MPSSRTIAALAGALLTLSASLSAAAPKLDLRIRDNPGFAPCNASSTVFEPAFRIDNRDSAAVATSTITLKFWFNSATAISFNWCSNVGVYNSAGTLQGWETVSGAKTSISTCTVGAKKGNQLFTLSFTGGLSVPAGGYINVVDYCQFWRGGFAPFDDNCDDYSTETSASLVQNSTVGLYVSSSLLCESASSSPGYDDASSGVDACTGANACAVSSPTSTITPSRTATPTFSASPSATRTATPVSAFSATPTPLMPLVKSANVSTATIGDTITFYFNWGNDSSTTQTVHFWDTISSYTTFIGCDTGCGYAGGLASWSFSAASGSSGQVALWVQITGYPP